jgi:uracil-DNA glycosylase
MANTAIESYASQGMTRQNGGSYRQVDGSSGSYSFSLQCYGQDICPKGENVIRETNGPHGRTIWYVEDQLFMPRNERELETGKERSGKRRKRSTVISFPGQDLDLHGVPTYVIVADRLNEESWKEKLQEFQSSETFDELSRFVKSEREESTIFPPPHEVFTALNTCPFDKVKVVIIGQDPYHGKDQGHGLAFSVQKGVPPPPSLKNIFKEAVDDCLIDYPEHGNLMSWAEQGVLLLNTVLTVRQGKANSHKNIGWEAFTDEIVDVLNREKNGLVFQLWGASAAKKGKNVDKNKHTVIVTSHPSPLGATKTNAPFLVSAYKMNRVKFLKNGVFNAIKSLLRLCTNREANVSVNVIQHLKNRD